LPGASIAPLSPLARSVGGLRFIDGGWRQQRTAGTRVRAMGCPEADVGKFRKKRRRELIQKHLGSMQFTYELKFEEMKI
jgi:hypothetical protein